MTRAKRNVTLQLPPEFIELCKHDLVCPSLILRGFIADLCGIMNWASDPRIDGYSSNGSDERDFARQYYDRVGYSYEGEWRRQNETDRKIPCAKPTSTDCRCRQRRALRSKLEEKHEFG
ncbi:MAG TPA: hypothetical protein V6C86_05685 [Oculatellaceae cyanobacterium]